MATIVPRFWLPRDGFRPSPSILHAITALLIIVALGCSSAAADEESESFSVRSETDAALRLTASTVEPGPTAGPADGKRPGVTSTTVPSTDPSTHPTRSDGSGNAASAAEARSPSVGVRPDWLGRRPLPTTPDGLVVVPQTTPEALRDRRFATIDTLPPPTGDGFTPRSGPVPTEVLTRSTWVDGCPVPVDGLRYLTLPFRGFDGRVHTGELIVNATVADDIVSVFEKLFDAGFPIEEMRVVSMADLEAAPTGDGNNTTSFVCRPVTGGTAFSQHAHGLAIDINPFHNPYLRGGLLLPELSEAYLDRSTEKAGTILAGDVVVDAFADVGWSWGGDWRSLKDYQHFSANNR